MDNIIEWAQNDIPPQVQSQEILAFLDGVDQVVLNNISTIIEDVNTNYGITHERKFLFINGGIHILIRWFYKDLLVGKKPIGESVMIINPQNVNFEVTGSLIVNAMDVFFTSQHLMDFKSIIGNLTYRIRKLFKRIYDQFQSPQANRSAPRTPMQTQKPPQPQNPMGFKLPTFSKIPTQNPIQQPMAPTQNTQPVQPVMNKMGTQNFNRGFSVGGFAKPSRYTAKTQMMPKKEENKFEALDNFNKKSKKSKKENVQVEQPKEDLEDEMDLFEGKPTSKDELPQIPVIPKMNVGSIRGGNKTKR